MKKLILGLLFLTFLSACSVEHDNKKHTRFSYGQGVLIKDGFFKDYLAVVLEEYPKGCSLFVQLIAHRENGADNDIQEQYKRRLNLDCDDVEAIK